MNKKHFCKECKYDTDKRSSWKKHITSKKHQLNTAENSDSHKKSLKIILGASIQQKSAQNTSAFSFIDCQYCKKTFSCASNRSRHEKSCKINYLDSETSKILLEEEKKRNKLKEHEFHKSEQRYKKMIAYLSGKLEKMTEIAINKPTTINNTINNSLSFVNTNYSGVSALESLPNKKYINMFIDNTKDSSIKKIKDCDKDDERDCVKDDEFDLSDVDDDDDNLDAFVTDIVAYERMHTLSRFLGDFLISNYVKKDKSKQSLHLVDGSRMKFIYAKLKNSIKNKNNKIDWKADLRGNNIKKIIIEPMLNFIRIQIRTYQKELAQKFINHPRDVSDSEMTLMQELHKLDILLDTSVARNKKRDITKEILIYIAPYFKFDKDLYIED